MNKNWIEDGNPNGSRREVEIADRIREQSRPQTPEGDAEGSRLANRAKPIAVEAELAHQGG